MATLFPPELTEDLTEDQQIKLAEIMLLMERIGVLMEEPDIGGFFAYKLTLEASTSSGYKAAEQYWQNKAAEYLTKHAPQVDLQAQQRDLLHQQQLAALQNRYYGQTIGTITSTGLTPMTSDNPNKTEDRVTMMERLLGYK